jgi:hypothetical protein
MQFPCQAISAKNGQKTGEFGNKQQIRDIMAQFKQGWNRDKMTLFSRLAKSG